MTEEKIINIEVATDIINACIGKAYREHGAESEELTRLYEEKDKILDGDEEVIKKVIEEYSKSSSKE